VERLGLGSSAYEAFRVLGPRCAQGALALFEDMLGAAVMDVIWGEHCDPAVAVFGVVPVEERAAERGRGVDV